MVNSVYLGLKGQKLTLDDPIPPRVMVAVISTPVIVFTTCGTLVIIDNTSDVSLAAPISP